MNSLEVLRFAWTPSCLRLLLAAGADSGPVDERAWSIRAGLPRNHVGATIVECERLGGLKHEVRAEGLALFVQPVSFWRVKPKHEAGEWSMAWHGVEQRRLALVTESMDLRSALHEVGRDQGSTESRPTVLPESGATHGDISGIRRMAAAPCRPESGGDRDHGTDHDHGSGSPNMTERACRNHDHGAAHRISEIKGTARAARRALPGGKERARELIGTYLHGLTAQNAERWERRVHENAELVEFAIEEAASRRERLDRPMAAYANRVYLSRINLKAPAVRQAK